MTSFFLELSISSFGLVLTAGNKLRKILTVLETFCSIYQETIVVVKCNLHEGIETIFAPVPKLQEFC